MIGKTNVLYGAGGPGNPESGMAMLVTYPEGSICTCVRPSSEEALHTQNVSASGSYVSYDISTMPMVVGNTYRIRGTLESGQDGNGETLTIDNEFVLPSAGYANIYPSGTGQLDCGITIRNNYLSIEWADGYGFQGTLYVYSVVSEKSLRALDDSGACVFYIPSAGDWTVSASEDGAMIDKKTIAVTSGYQDAVELKASLTRQYLTDKLVSWEDDQVQTIADRAFSYRTSLNDVKTSALNIGSNAFNESGVKKIELTNTEPVILNSGSFNGAHKLNALIIHSMSAVTNVSTNVIEDTMIAAGEGGIYVPASLVDEYRSASNWLNYASRIYPIDSYPVTNFETISDSWSEIFAAENNGTYSTKYSLGDTKYLSYDGNNVLAEIIAIDTDIRSDGNGNAKITWLLKPLVEYAKMNSTSTNSGGWAECELRSYIRTSCIEKLPNDVKSKLVEVNKTYYDYATNSTLTIADTLWIPSFYEVTGNSNMAENSGVTYPYLYGNIAYNVGCFKRIKYDLTCTRKYWALRSASNSSATSYRLVGSTGAAASSGSAATSDYITLGFCT